MVLARIKRLFGLGDAAETEAGESDRTTVSVEHDPEGTDAEPTPPSTPDPDTTTERAVKGDESTERDEPVATGTDAAASTGSVVDTESADDPAEAAEPAEAAGPESDDVDTDLGEEESAADDVSGVADRDDPVETVTGIGPAYGERLGEIGIETVADLATADAAAVAEQTSVSESRVEKWIARAQGEED